MPRECFPIFPTKRDQGRSEKWLVPKLGQGRCKMSLEHSSKPESKEVHGKHNGVSDKDWGDHSKVSHWPNSIQPEHPIINTRVNY